MANVGTPPRTHIYTLRLSPAAGTQADTVCDTLRQLVANDPEQHGTLEFLEKLAVFVPRHHARVPVKVSCVGRKRGGGGVGVGVEKELGGGHGVMRCKLSMSTWRASPEGTVVCARCGSYRRS